MQPEADGRANGFYSPRELTYIEPAARRLSDYEAVICHVQPDVHHDDSGGWLLLGADGQDLFEASSTRLQHPDWFQYRDPSSYWQRTYVREQAIQERSTDDLLEAARHNGCFGEVDDYWAREVLARYHQGFAFYEWGTYLALNRCVRHALSDTLTMMLTFTAVDRLRHQQAIALYGLALEQERGLVEEGHGREAWLLDPAYQPTRAAIERLMTVEDWCEAALVCGLLLDPLLNDFVMGNFFRRFAPVNGDAITPILAMAADRDRRRYQSAVRALVEMALVDSDRRGRPVPALENRIVLQDWIDDWGPTVLDALEAFAPVYDTPTMRPQTAEAARDRVIRSCEESLNRYGLELRC